MTRSIPSLGRLLHSACRAGIAFVAPVSLLALLLLAGCATTTYLLSPKVRHFGQSALGIVPLDDFVAVTIVK